MLNSFAQKIDSYNRRLDLPIDMPNVRVMNPFRDEEGVLEIADRFYNKYYNDKNKRHLVLGINPGRFGAGLTGVPFTDPNRLVEKCGIPYNKPLVTELSSIFVYEMIDAFGGVIPFYKSFFIHSICPLGLTYLQPNGKEVNYNYYDSKPLLDSLMLLMADHIQSLIDIGGYTDTCYCLGTGKNKTVFEGINEKHQFFKEIIFLEHPRYIMQYKRKEKEQYIRRYLNAFEKVVL